MHDKIKRAKMTPFNAKRHVKIDAKIGPYFFAFKWLPSVMGMQIHLVIHFESLAKHSSTREIVWNNNSGHGLMKGYAYWITVTMPAASKTATGSKREFKLEFLRIEN
ncbi:MAG: hypothetical protein OEW33_13950 [Nitrospirota bacterium]|nr:hypothetical protein [Nitrospirota bacterium]